MARRILVATRKGLFTIEKARDRWDVARVDFLGDTVGMTLADPRDGALYAALEHGHFGPKLHRSDDGGTTWSEIGLPTYPAPEPGQEDVDPQTGAVKPWKLEKIWALEPGGPDEPGGIWCGTMPGGLFRSTDKGATWDLNKPLWFDPRRKGWFGGGGIFPGIHSVCVHPQDSNRVAVSISCGGVWMTDDGGLTWAPRATGMWAAYMPPEMKDDPNIQDPHRVVQCRAQTDCLWAQHHNGIFRTTDAGASWTEVKDVPPSSFGFAVAVHPRDPDTAWFVPGVKDEKRYPVDGRVVVTRTRDGGRSFDVLREGLPQVHAYDLVYRHALDIDDSGDLLAFGSTTGSLWVSEDQGDTWRCVSQHLPPIYTVRFAA